MGGGRAGVDRADGRVTPYTPPSSRHCAPSSLARCAENAKRSHCPLKELSVGFQNRYAALMGAAKSQTQPFRPTKYYELGRSACVARPC